MRSIVISLQVKGELPSLWHVICKSGPYQSTDTTEQILQTGIELKAEGGFFVAHYFILNCKCSKNTSVTPEWSCSKKQNKIKPRWGCEEGIHLLCWFLYWPVWKWKTAQGPFVGAAPSSLSLPLCLDAFETGREGMQLGEGILGDEWLHVLRCF